MSRNEVAASSLAVLAADDELGAHRRLLAATWSTSVKRWRALRGGARRQLISIWAEVAGLDPGLVARVGPELTATVCNGDGTLAPEASAYLVRLAVKIAGGDQDTLRRKLADQESTIARLVTMLKKPHPKGAAVQ